MFKEDLKCETNGALVQSMESRVLLTIILFHAALGSNLGIARSPGQLTGNKNSSKYFYIFTLSGKQLSSIKKHVSQTLKASALL